MSEHRIIIFDGVCNFCNGAVLFIIRRDPHGKFKFAPMQSATGQKLIVEYEASGVTDDSFLLIEGDSCRLRTDAALTIAGELTWPWPVFKVLTILPAAFRDYFYDLFARNRYSLFGKRDSCMMPTEDVKNRFMDAT